MLSPNGENTQVLHAMVVAFENVWSLFLIDLRDYKNDTFKASITKLRNCENNISMNHCVSSIFAFNHVRCWLF